MKPVNSFVNPLLTDLYQLTMAYAYWKNKIHMKRAVFDLFFRKNPFKGAYTVFAGLSEVLSYLSSFQFTPEQLSYIKTRLCPDCDPEFYTWLEGIDCSEITLYAFDEGTIVFPREPIIRVEGPLAICQLLETTLLTLVNYPSLVATNAARFRIAAGFDKVLLEFGLRRAQGPDGGISASRYSYMGGCDGSSNVLAGHLFQIPVKGTHAHAFVQSFHGISDLDKDQKFIGVDNKEHDFVKLILDIREELGYTQTNEGELAAFIAYARSFPTGFLALVDTYDTLQSGVPNFICVAAVLSRLGYSPTGIRLDSGDLAFLSKASRAMFLEAGQKTKTNLSQCKIAASNDINEEILLSLNQQGHEIDIFGIGTNLVTCQAQPALGCVYKLVEIEGSPRIKLSQQVIKVTIPGRKDVYRLTNKYDYALADIMVMVGEHEPEKGKQMLCVHPFDETKRVYIVPSKVEKLNKCYWDGELMADLSSLDEQRSYIFSQLQKIREDYARPTNPTSYKVSVTGTLYKFIHELWAKEAPIMVIE
ncbi:MAG: nicotinate phosphoribosyltransferase [Spirochaetales bacterium]|nr:nicotinate phosphoribosyltransferase [Spirochaetales bacterium]